MASLASSQADLQSRISELQKKRIELEKRVEQKRLSRTISNDQELQQPLLDNSDSRSETPIPVLCASPTPLSQSPRLPSRVMSPVVSLARAKEAYITQISKDLPQWITLKQQREAEEISEIQRSIEVVNESKLVIQGEITKHMEYMRELNEKKAELMRQHEAEVYENAMRKNKWSTVQKGVDENQQVQPLFHQLSPKQPQQHPQQAQQQAQSPSVVNYGFTHRSAQEFLERTAPIEVAALYLPTFGSPKSSSPSTDPARKSKGSMSSTREMLNESLPPENRRRRSTPGSSPPPIPSEAAPRSPLPPRARRHQRGDSLNSSHSASDLEQEYGSITLVSPTKDLKLLDRILDTGPVLVKGVPPGRKEEFGYSESTTSVGRENNCSTTTRPDILPSPSTRRGSGDAVRPRGFREFSDSPRPRRNSKDGPKSPSPTAVPPNPLKHLKFAKGLVGSHDIRLEMLKKDIRRGKENDTDAEVEMGSPHDSKEDDTEEEEYSVEQNNNYMRVASKESINDRYVTNTNMTPSESENETTDTHTFRTDTESDDFFISHTKHTNNTVKTTGGTKREPKTDRSEQSDSASDDFFISVNKTKNPTSIIQGNGIIASSPVLLKSPSGIIRDTNSPKSPSRKSRKDRKGRSPKKSSKGDKKGKTRSSPPLVSDDTVTDENLEEEFEELELFEFEDFVEPPELPEFSDISSVSSPTPRRAYSSNASTPRIVNPPPPSSSFRNVHANAFLDTASSSSTLHTINSSPNPGRGLPMDPSSLSLMSHLRSPDADDHGLPRLPSSPSVKMAKGNSVKFQDGSGPPRSAFVDSDSASPSESEESVIAQPQPASVSPPVSARQHMKLEISKLPTQSSLIQSKDNGKDKKVKPVTSSLSMVRSMQDKLETLDHGRVLRRLVAYIERDPQDEFLYRSRTDAKLIKEIKVTAEREPRQLLKYKVRDCCAALLDTIKSFPGGLLSQQFVDYLMEHDSYNEEGLLEFSPLSMSEFWNTLLEHLEVLHARHLMPWNQIISVFGNVILAGLSNLDMSSKEFVIHAKHEALRQYLQRDPDSNITELYKFIGDTDLSVIFALVTCQEAHKTQETEHNNPYTEAFSFYVTSEEVRLASAFVAVWLTGSSQEDGEGEELAVNRTWPLVSTILSHEFGAMETRVKLLDGVSFGSALIATYGRIVGREYIKSIITPVINMMVQNPSSIEVNPTRIKGKNANEEANILTKNKNNLKTACELVMEKVVALKEDISGDLADVLLHVYTLIQEYMNGNKQIASTTLQKIFWDCWICPALAQPSLVGLSVPDTEPVRRALGLLTHSLRAAALGEETDQQLVSSLTPKFVSTFDSILPVFINPRRYMTLFNEGLSKEAGLREILSLLKIHFNKVIKFLQSHDSISAKVHNFLAAVLTDRLKSGKKIRDRRGSMDLSTDFGTDKTLLERPMSMMFDGSDSEQYEENIKI